MLAPEQLTVRCCDSIGNQQIRAEAIQHSGAQSLYETMPYKVTYIYPRCVSCLIRVNSTSTIRSRSLLRGNRKGRSLQRCVASVGSQMRPLQMHFLCAVSGFKRSAKALAVLGWRKKLSCFGCYVMEVFEPLKPLQSTVGNRL